MSVVIFIAILFVAVLVIAGPLMFLRLQKAFQSTTNFERGLEMVPLLIHLPPAADDIEGNGRDARDIVDENISKAQVIYNIISSTAEKSFKNNIHGQRHFAFEIVGSKGFVYLYAAVPTTMVDTVKQAVVSAYPSARLEQVTEHNIFSDTGKLGATVGGEMVLKESFAYPIATYQDLKRDALQAILNALSTLEKTDGAAIQLLFRPADQSWRKQASELASNKRGGGDDKAIKASKLAKELVTAFVKPPEAKEDGKSDKPELSSLEQSVLDSIDDKTRYPGFETTIRVVASSNLLQRSQSILNNIVASFSLFDAPGKNGFKYEAAKDIAEFVTSYILRFFSVRQKKNILNTVELATLFHFPDQRSVPTSQLERQESKQVDGPRNVPETGLLLGYNVFRGVKKPIRLGLTDRQRHMYVVGQTGTGKSTFLENLALQDMLNGGGFAFVDPHGDTAENLLAMVPKERTEDVIYFCPSDMDYPMGLNLFEYDAPDQKDFLIQEALNMLYKLYDPQHQGIIGPRYENIFRNAALAIMADPAGGTFVDIPKLFRDPQFLKQKLQHVSDINVLDYWQKEYPASQRSNEAGEITSWFVSKFGAFLSNEMMRNIIGQTKSAFNLRDIMDNKKILLVNLSKGRTGELNSKLLGMIFVMKFQAAAMSRSDIPESERKDFALYVDEFQNFSTDSFATIMSEARKYHLNLIVANQFTTQLTEEIRDAVFGNIGTIVSFRIGQNDVEALGRYFQPIFTGDDLLRVPNHNTIIRTLIGGVPTQPFSMATLPPLGRPNPQLATALKQLSAAKHGQPRAQVEKHIFERLTPKQVDTKFDNPFVDRSAPSSPAQQFGAAAPNPYAPGGGGQSPFGPGAPASVGQQFGSAAGQPRQRMPSPPSTGSFLDEWLAKQRAKAPTPPIAGSGMDASGSMTMAAPEDTDRAFDPLMGSPAAEELPSGAPMGPDPMAGLQPVAEAPAEPEEAPNESEPTGNVSSAQIDQQEIDDIADVLKRNLNTPLPGEEMRPTVAVPELSVTQVPAQPEPEPEPEPEEHTVELVQPPKQAEEDTIFIDNDGMLHINNTPEPTADASSAAPEATGTTPTGEGASSPAAPAAAASQPDIEVPEPKLVDTESSAPKSAESAESPHEKGTELADAEAILANLPAVSSDGDQSHHEPESKDEKDEHAKSEDSRPAHSAPPLPEHHADDRSFGRHGGSRGRDGRKPANRG